MSLFDEPGWNLKISFLFFSPLRHLTCCLLKRCMYIYKQIFPFRSYILIRASQSVYFLLVFRTKKTGVDPSKLYFRFSGKWVRNRFTFFSVDCVIWYVIWRRCLSNAPQQLPSGFSVRWGGSTTEMLGPPENTLSSTDPIPTMVLYLTPVPFLPAPTIYATTTDSSYCSLSHQVFFFLWYYYFYLFNPRRSYVPLC